MARFSLFFRLLVIFSTGSGVAAAATSADEPASAGKVSLKAEPVLDDAPAASLASMPAPDIKKDLAASWKTQNNARILTLSIPAPRGQIVDRNGASFAQNRVVHYLALNFPNLDPATPEKILDFAHTKIASANRLLGKSWALSDEVLLRHYQNRRWLPLVFSIDGGMNTALADLEREKIKPLLGSGLFLQAAYIRHYPKDSTACHIIGYAGKLRPLPVAPIQEGDPIFEELEGREGLESSFNSDLTGTPGLKSVIFSPEGKQLSEEMVRHPVPGHNIVTSLDYNYQRYAESALAKHARNGGAMVVMDVRSGDVLAIASNPGYNLNDFIPGISQEELNALDHDPRLPRYPRAFLGEYPPASTFKVIVALAGLESGAITGRTTFDCDASFTIGKTVMHNWAKEGEGPMTVVNAIKRSCNTWFYQAGLQTGADAVTSMATRMGFGEKTGLPLKGEASGFVPSNAYMLQRYGHKILSGDLANMSIGQGRVLATPIQVCQAMAGVADGLNMPQVRLVRQIQDVNDQVIKSFPIQTRRRIDLKTSARDTVVKGMVAVVSGENGTGSRGGIKHAQVAAKTGTAQWKPAKSQNLAWFTGFVPANNPVYAFCVVYEGTPGEEISGGKKAAPIVHDVLTSIYENAPPEDPFILAANAKDAPKAKPVDDDEDRDDNADSAPKAKKVKENPEAAPPPPPSEEPKGVKGFFRRLFGR